MVAFILHVEIWLIILIKLCFTRTENGDDNVLLGLAVGMTTTELQVTDPRDDSGDTKLHACPVLMCLSLGGKLSLFSVARWVSYIRYSGHLILLIEGVFSVGGLSRDSLKVLCMSGRYRIYR